MKRNRSHGPLRGTFVIRKIIIEGFSSPLIVEDGKHIKDWKPGFRDRLRKESLNLEKLAKHMATQRKSVSPVDISRLSSVVDDAHTELEGLEWLNVDEENEWQMETNGFASINDERKFWLF
jgi:hypothetical protein